MRRICPSVKGDDGYVRKLPQPAPARIACGMVAVDIELVRNVLRKAISDGAFSQRGLSRSAGLNRDAVYDILNGRNENPTVSHLAALADAMGEDLSIFGLTTPEIVTNVAELERAIAEALPSLPSRPEKQARYLAEVVAAELGLPQDREATSGHPLP
jgi:transcriptional regulator with XRE-family HTH domain